jgi:hypothetical protein
MAALDTQEVEQRVAVLKRLKKLLFGQREKFRTYLDVLEHQETDIAEGDTDKLQAHVALEKAIVSEIYSFQKVIDPLEDMYRLAYPNREEETEIYEIKGSLDKIRDEVLDRNRRNQELLRNDMGSLRQTIAGVRSLRKLTSVMPMESTPTLIDTTA